MLLSNPTELKAALPPPATFNFGQRDKPRSMAEMGENASLFHQCQSSTASGLAGAPLAPAASAPYVALGSIATRQPMYTVLVLRVSPQPPHKATLWEV